MNAHLRACPACSRHVRVSEAACPFCQAALSDSFRAASAPEPPRARLTRAALFAIGTSAAALAPGCAATAPTGTTIAVYGAPPTSHAGSDASADAEPVFDDGGAGIALYGAAPAPGH